MACGAWKQKFDNAFSSHASKVLVHTCEVTSKERSEILADFSCGKDSMALVTHAKFNIYQSLPHHVLGIAHDSEEEGRYCAQTCLSMFTQLDPSKDHETIQHPLVQKLLSPNGSLNKALKEFARGASRLSLPAVFKSELTILRLVPVAEVSIEAKHAVAKNALLSVKRASPALFSLSLRWREVRMLMQDSPSMELLLEIFERFRKTPVDILQDFDMASHPEVQECLADLDTLKVGEARLSLLKVARQVFYRCGFDLTVLSEALGGLQHEATISLSFSTNRQF